MAVFRFPSIVAIAATILPVLLHAQQPTPEQVERMLQARPELAETLRSKIETSGLSPEQIRARLEAAGYSRDLLDRYLGEQTTASGAPNDDVLRAVRFLGLVDSLEVEALRQGRPAITPVPAPAPKTTAPATAQADSALRIFGLDVFRRSSSQFEPDIAGPVGPNYRVGPRDVLALILTGGIENSFSLEVTREGFIVVPQVGQIYVANMTLEEIEDVLFQRLRAVYSGVGRGADASTRFHVTVAKLRSNQVFVIGEVVAPGSYQVSSLGTILTALYAAGGPNDNGSLRRIELRRRGQTVTTFDAYDYLVRGDASRDLPLQNGDVIFVGVHGPFTTVLGEVIRPAVFELRDGETLADLITLAGGFTAQADRRRVLVNRIVPPGQRVRAGHDRVVLDILTSPDGTVPPFQLERGDNVQVFRIADRVRHQVTVEGNVWSPGNLALTGGMRLSDALRRVGGVRPDAKDVLISRLQSDQTRRQLRTAFVDSSGTPTDDILLQEDDSIRVFGLSEFRPDRYVVITGAVRTGGRFPYREGMTLRDLVHLARGLDEGAYLGRAEVARLPEDRSRGQMATVLTVPLDSSYILERGLDGTYHGPPGLPAASSSSDMPLAAYDNVLILRQPEWQLQRTVSITGEVRFPGTYSLTSKQERIADLVKRAGGLTPGAYAGGVVFVRTVDGIGRIGVNLERALRDLRSRDNYLLQMGDSIFVPEYRATVKVEGAVNSPLAIGFVPGKDLKYYVEAAGGLAYNADGSRMYVRQPNGEVEAMVERFLLPDGSPEPRPGATVVVPARDPDQKTDWTSLAGTVAQVLASVVAIIAISTR